MIFKKGETIYQRNTFLPSWFSIFLMCDDLSFINTAQKTFKASEKNVSMPRMDVKKLHTWEFPLKRSSGNMRCKLFQKRFTGKSTECSKHLRHWKKYCPESSIKTKSLITKPCPAGLSPRIIGQPSPILPKMLQNCCTHQVWTVPPSPEPLWVTLEMGKNSTQKSKFTHFFHQKNPS